MGATVMTTEKRLSTSMARVSRTGVACLLVCVAALPPGRATADEGLPPRPPRTVEAFDALPVSAAEPTPTQSFDHAQGTASFLAYQSFVDGNWEIYLTQNDTGGTVRLTADPASDLEPKISPDLTRVVFTSRRTGNYDLFRVNVDGTGLVQLTNHGATDSAATWSPDGTRLAFQSRRNGNDDVYVMNADGGGLVQLTSNLDYDGEPAWSPDGRQIAFVSRRSPGDQSYFLYVMNTDGSGQRLLAALPYSSRPAWSYAGQRILFDAFDSTAGQRLYLYDFADGSTRATGHFPVSSYRYADVLSGTWGIADSAVVTLVSYVYANGQWYIQAMELWSINVAQSWVGNRIGSDQSGYPSWGNPDHRAPNTTPWFPAMPAMTWTNVEVRVTGSDVGIAGIASIEFQTRRSAAESWNTVTAQCERLDPFTWRCYVYSSSDSLQVRTRAYDAFGNREEWSNDPQRWATTDLYYRRLMGTVSDVRGLPLANVALSGVPTQVEASVVTDRDGHWRASQRGSDTGYTVTASLAGSTASLGVDQFTSTNVERVIRGDITLLPADNVLANPGFEIAGSAWAPINATLPQWLAAGGFNTPSATLRLGGETAYTTFNYSADDVVAVQVGDITVIGSNNTNSSMLTLCPAGQACQTLDPFNGLLQDLGAAGDGTLGMIVTQLGQPSQFLRRAPDGSWLAAEPYPYLIYDSNHSLLADTQGRWHFVYTDPNGTVYLTRRADGGGWSTPVAIASMPMGMDVAFDTGDVLRAVGCTFSGVAQVTWSAWTGASAPATISSELCANNAIALQIDDAGYAYAVWATDSIRFSRRPPAGEWSTPVPLAGSMPALQGLVAGSGGRPRVAVTDGDARMLLMEVSAAGEWSSLNTRTLAAPTSSSTSRLLSIDLTARRLISSNLAWDGFWKNLVSYPLVDASGAIGVSQVVTIPAGQTAPTLYARYRYMITDPVDALEMWIQASDALTPTVLTLPGMGGTAWTSEWFDVSAWAGQTVTLTVRLQDAGGGSAPTADLDTVTLGSWTTPTISDLSPTALAGAGDVFTITGERFAPTTSVFVGGRAATVTLIDAEHLSVTLPANHAIGPQTVLVVNTGGFAAQAAQTLYVGSDWLTLPVLLRWTP